MSKRISLPRFEVILASAFLLVLVLGVFLSPVLPLPDPLKQNLLSTRAMPSWDHPFGTDSLGRDVLSRLLFGGREVLLGSVLSLIVALILGGTAGLTGGYLKGGFDRFAGAIADMLQSIPGITIMLAVLAVFSNNTYAAMIAFGVLMSGALFRIVRAATLAVAEETYIEAARLSGMRDLAIIFPPFGGPSRASAHRPDLRRVVAVPGQSHRPRRARPRFAPAQPVLGQFSAGSRRIDLHRALGCLHLRLPS